MTFIEVWVQVGRLQQCYYCFCTDFDSLKDIGKGQPQMSTKNILQKCTFEQVEYGSWFLMGVLCKLLTYEKSYDLHMRVYQN
jgi:hypothetical protein